MGRIVFTDRVLKAWARQPPKRDETYLDAIVPGLGFRRRTSGRCSHVLIARFPPSRNPTRRSLGDYGALTLEEARAKARAWQGMIQRGIDRDRRTRRARRKYPPTKKHVCRSA